VKKLAVILLILSSLAACEERYRYFCQDPANWQQKRCQRPDCLFTQDCPDYLVAPVLEKQIVQQAPTPAQAASDR
jgi:hypothetical protein